MSGAVESRLAPGSNVLVLADRSDPEATATCYRLLTAPDADPATLNVVQVSCTRSPDQLVSEWNDHVGTPPGSFHVVSALGGPSLGDETPSGPEGVSVVSAHPSDLTGLAMRMRDSVEQGMAHDGPLTVGVDALTPLLEYNSVQSTYKFLHMFSGRLAEVSASTHFLLDPNACDEQTVHKLKTLVDDVVTLDG
ncbi:DUF7504 family protein [Halorussus salinus]|uniref:DUF7504 family protein n=1 Tax=Halorussus salinus TaxID=1364935 RepID=UPI001092834D|nr:hypothetical protein [Halorussus salinus]